MGSLGRDRLASAALADRVFPVPHQHPRHRLQLHQQDHQPANRSSATRDGSSRAASQRA
jgi:hypothetical protein